MATGTRKTGEFCWTNMLTPRPAEARAFFGTLLGWTYIEMPGIGHAVTVDGHHIGGLFDLDGPSTPPGTRAILGVMVKVESADATAARIVELGGKAKPPFDIGNQGRMAVCHDPIGAKFDLWEPKKMHGTDVDRSRHGAPSWFETLTTDVPRATTFYSQLFGWKPEVFSTPGLAYTTFKQGEAPVAGLMAMPPAMGTLEPHWGTYFTVTNIEATAEQAVNLGATLCVPVRDIPGIGRFCGITSPQGIPFYGIEYIR